MAATGSAANKAMADEHAALLLPIVRDIQASGSVTLTAIATALNARGITARRGGSWSGGQVRALLKRD